MDIIYLLSSHPFYKSLEEIGSMSFQQCRLLIAHHQKIKEKKFKEMSQRVRANSKKIQYVHEIAPYIE